MKNNISIIGIPILVLSMLIVSCNKEKPVVDDQLVPAERVVYLDASAPATRAGIDSEGNGFTIDSWTEGDVIRMVYLKDSQYTSLDFAYNAEDKKFRANLPAGVESIDAIKSDVSGLVYCAGQLNSENGVVALNPSEIKVDKENKTTNLSLFASKETIAFNGNEVSAWMIMDYAIVVVSNKAKVAKEIRFAKKVGEDFIGLVSLACSPTEGIVAAYAAESGVANASQFTIPAGGKVYFPIPKGVEIGIFNDDCTPIKNPRTLSSNTTYNVDIPVDLSEGGKANTYIVVGAGNYKFPTVKGNSEVSVGDVASVEVLWESFGTNVAPAVGALVSSAVFKDGYISFVASDKKGNAVIAAKDANGTILWSWHIWMTDQPGIQEYYCNQTGKPWPQMMDRNLGATSAEPGAVEALGLFYQWGRKDPFMGPSGIAESSFAASTLNWPASVASSATVGTIKYATEHPTTFISTNSDGNWLNTRDTDLWKEEPTIYDPCPAGYRLPYNNVWTWSLGTTGSWKNASNFNETWKGMNFGATDKKMGADKTIWYPDQGNYHQNGSGLVNVAGWGDYWSITLVSNKSQAYCLELGSDGTVNPSKERNFAYGQAVRCQKTYSVNPGSGSEDDITLPKIEVSRLKKTSDGKVYLEVDGKPFPLFGAQIRLDILKNCDKMSDEGIENHFVSAKDLNVNCVQVPVTWNMIEPEEGQYDYSMADFILRLANKYNLKVELLWFGTDMIGESFSYLVPSYVFANNDATMIRGKENQVHNLYGYYHAVIFDNPWVLERECKAVTKLFNHIREWDEKNGKKHPVITCQLHNEIDGLMRYKMINDNFTFRDGTPLTQERAWNMSLNAVDAIGKAVKNSLYKVVTRVNYMSNSSSGSFPQYTAAHATDALKYEGVDFISVDPYKMAINDVADVVESYTLPDWNYPLVAENRGYYDTTPNLILATAALGGGYDIYDLATSKFIYDNNQEPFKEEGVLTYDLKDRAHTPLTRAILKGITAASEDVALVSTENFAPFNIKNSRPHSSEDQTICTTGAKFTISTIQSSIGFVLDRGSYLLMYFTAPTSVTVSNGVTADGKTSYNLEGGKLFKVGFKSNGKLSSTTRSFIGTR